MLVQTPLIKMVQTLLNAPTKRGGSSKIKPTLPIFPCFHLPSQPDPTKGLTLEDFLCATGAHTIIHLPPFVANATIVVKWATSPMHVVDPFEPKSSKYWWRTTCFTRGCLLQLWRPKPLPQCMSEVNDRELCSSQPSLPRKGRSSFQRRSNLNQRQGRSWYVSVYTHLIPIRISTVAICFLLKLDAYLFLFLN